MTNNKTIKLIAASAIAISVLGANAALPTSNVFASSITQKSGDETKGKIEATTNAFSTYEAAEKFAFGELEKILAGQSYKNSVVPTNPNGYVAIATIDYDEMTTKAEAEALAKKVVDAADAAIAAEKPAPQPQPQPQPEPEKPQPQPQPQPEPEKPGTENPAQPEKPQPQPEKPGTENPAKPEKPAEPGKPAQPEKPSQDAQKPSQDTQKPGDKDVQALDKSEQKTKDANKLKAGENLKVDKSEAEAKSVDKEETLPKTAATTSSVANTLAGVVAIAMATFIAIRKKMFN